MNSSFDAAVNRIRSSLGDLPTLGVVLGSGFQSVLAELEVTARLGFASIPGCHRPSVPGHQEAEIVVAKLGGAKAVMVTGRMHYYEGHTMETVTLPVRALAQLGLRTLVLTNAVGGIRSGFQVGDLMCVTDHINFTGVNPLRGALGAGGAGFVDLTELYSPHVNEVVEKQGRQHGFVVHEGVYMAVSGPSFETPAEIRMFERLGGDVVGMSTVPEAIAAKQAGLEVAALSCVTNLAAGLSADPIRHGDVLEVLRERSNRLGQVIAGVCQELSA